MINNLDPKEWNELIKKYRDEIHQKLKSMNIPIIYGQVHGGGAVIINTNLLEIFNLGGLINIDDYKSLLTEGTLAVIDVDTKKIEGATYLTEITTYIRLGTTNTYLHTSISSVTEEDDDDFEYEGEDPVNEITEDEIDKAAVLVACESNFRLLKNKDQREEFTKSFLIKNKLEFQDYTIRSISYRAEVIYGFGILPTQINEYIEEGKSTNEISKLLGITKNRVEKLANVEPPDYLISLIKK